MNKLLLFLILSMIGIALLSSFNLKHTQLAESQNSAFTVPENIDVIFSKSCYSCHSVESTTYKAKMKLKLDELETMKLSKLISKLNKIAKEVGKGDMPTKKFAKNYPDKMPTDEDKKTLINWARNSAKKLAGE